MDKEREAIRKLKGQSSDHPTKAVRPARPATDCYAFLAPPVERDEIGRLGNYRVLRLLGSGAMGFVFLAEDVALQRPVALKVMKPELDKGGGQAWMRFLREARAMAAIKHENLITIYQVGQEGQTVYFAMELLEGETLEDRLQRGEPLDVAEILRIGREIAVGLAAIHAKGLIHRDVKPSNLWLESVVHGPSSVARGNDSATDHGLRTTDYRVKILDFGLARGTKEEMQLTESGMVVGTPAYLSPEQARGRPLDARSDLFSLGCVLYRMCTREFPFQAENTMDQLAALVADDPTPIRDLNPGIPQVLEDFIMELLAKEPEERPSSAAHVAERLAQIRRTLTKRSPRPSSRGTQRLPRSGVHGALPSFLGGWKVPLVVVVAAAAIVVAVYLMGGFGGPEKKNGPAPPGEVKKPGDPVAPVVPAGDVVFLSDVPKLTAVNWPFQEPKDKKGEKKDKKGGKGPPPGMFETVKVNGAVSAHGIFMHAAPVHEEPASITFKLAGQFRTFAATVALNDTAPPDAEPVLFAVYGDNKELWKSPPVGSEDRPQRCEVPVVGVDTLKLEVTATGSPMGAHGVWFEPYLKK